MADMIDRIADVLGRLPVKAEPGSELDALRRREAARAILYEMREPTDRMTSEGESAASVGIGKPVDDEAIPRVWSAMIDAALKPPV